MSVFPGNIARVPLSLQNRVSLSLINRTNLGLFQVTQQLATGQRILRPGDDPVRAATISTIDSRLEGSAQRLRNLEFARGSLDTIDSTLSEIERLANEAHSIALGQVGSLSSAEERDGQASVVDSLIQSLLRLSNAESLSGHIFAGATPGSPAVVGSLNGFRYQGALANLFTDLGVGNSIPVGIRGQDVLGDVSGRIEGAVDLDPDLTLDTRLADLNGARDLGVTTGVVELSFNGGTRFTADLSGADTVGDAIDALTARIREYETTEGVTVLGPGGISISGESITVDAAAGSTLQVFDPSGGITGADLGLVLDPAAAFDGATTTGAALDPRVTWSTPLSAASGLSGPLTQLRVRNDGENRLIDLSGATTLGDVRSLIEANAPGVRVQISEDGNSIDVITEIAGAAGSALSIEDISGGSTALDLGIRSMAPWTLGSDLNDGRGISSVSGRTDPTTGLPDPALNVDFTVTLGDGTTSFDVDLQPADLADLSTIMAAINSQADAQLGAATDFDIALRADANGFVLSQDAAFGPGAISIERRNNSEAAFDLGLFDASAIAGGNLATGDIATVRVDNMFTALSDLAEALRNNDTTGIQFASERLETATDRLTELHGLMGGYAARVDDETQREEDRVILDESLRSRLRDTDYAQATSQLALLQTQLAATLQVTASQSQLTLLNFLG